MNVNKIIKYYLKIDLNDFTIKNRNKIKDKLNFLTSELEERKETSPNIGLAKTGADVGI